MLKIISQISGFIPLAVFTFSQLGRVKKFRNLKKVSAVIYFLAFAQLIDSAIFYQYGPSVLFYNCYTVLEYIVFAVLFVSFETEIKKQLYLPLCLGLFLIILPGYGELNIHGMFLESAILFLLSSRILYLSVLFNISGLWQDIKFWISLSSVLYYGINSIAFTFINYPFVQSIHALTNIVFNLLLTAGVLCKALHLIRFRQQHYSLQS